MARHDKAREDTARFELFLDESGTHEEGSTEPEQRKRGDQQGFASQIAGVLAPAGAIDDARARELLCSALAAAGGEFTGRIHAKDLRAGSDFDALVTAFADGLHDRGWHPVRIVNRERVSYGDRIATYTNLVAELVVRIFDRLHAADDRRIEITITAARVQLSETSAGVLEFLEKKEYLTRLRELIARIAVRRGHAERSGVWSLGAFRIKSANNTLPLMLADVVSNASHGKFRKLGDPARDALRAALEPFDFTLALREDVEAVRSLIDEGAHGLAIVRAAERIADRDLDHRVRDALRGLLNRAVDELAALGAPARDPQLQIVGSWLDQEVAHGQDLGKGRAESRQVARDIAERLRDTLADSPNPQSTAWFEYLVRRIELTAANHLGDIAAARDALQRMQPLEPVIASRWEHLALFVDAQHHEAVHLTDVWSFAESAAVAERTARFFEEVGSLFQAAMPDHFPDRVHARQRGEALGTAMQAAMYDGVLDPTRFDQARAWNDMAMAEFASQTDRRRQMQYRCQLETLAGDPEAAWVWLAKAVGQDDCQDASRIAEAIAALQANDPNRRFLLLHAYRLAAAATLAGHPLASSLREALEPRFADEVNSVTDPARHPAHATLRYRLEVLLGVDATNAAESCIAALRWISRPATGNSPLLTLHLVVAQARLAAHLRRANPAQAELLIFCPREQQPGLRQVVDSVARRIEPFEVLRDALASWSATVDALHTNIADDDAWARIDTLARQVAH